MILHPHDLCAVLEVIARLEDPDARPICPHPGLWDKGVPTMVAHLRAQADELQRIARTLEIAWREIERKRAEED